MALLSGSDLEVENVLIWNTEIPFANKVRQSSYFSLLDAKWCLRFSYRETITPTRLGLHLGDPTTENVFHAITLHRVINGEVAIATEALGQQRLEKSFSVETLLKHSTAPESGKTQTGRAVKTTATLWHAKSNKDIFQYLPSLYDRCEVKVVCRFNGCPLSAFQLKVGTENSVSMNLRKLQNQRRFVDKGVQASFQVPRNIESLCSDFCDLLEKEILPDVKLECGDRTFQAHRSVLAARSEVFRAMFENKMIESETGAVKIEDMDVAILEKLLKFLYSGKLEDLSESTTAGLYQAADKYGVISFKRSCSYWIVRNLTLENCIKYLKLADSHSDPDLKAAVISFIMKNPALLKSTQWSVLSKLLPALAVEVLETYVALTVQ